MCYRLCRTGVALAFSSARVSFQIETRASSWPGVAMSGVKSGTARRKDRKTTPPCVFHKGFITEKVDPVVDREWKDAFRVRAPFGDLRNMWRRHHCRLLNPYGDSERCPFSEQECGEAFLDAVRTVTIFRPNSPVGYFIGVAKRSGAVRADLGVERRAIAARLRTDVRNA